MSPPEFFPAHVPAPPFTSPPEDHALEQRVTKLAEFAQKNGLPFVNMIREKQAGNPEYSFLQEGPGAAFFNWRLYCYLFGLNPEEPLQLPPGQAAPHQSSHRSQASESVAGVSGQGQDTTQILQQAVADLPNDIGAAFAGVLGKLTGTRQSIKDSKEWFFVHANFASGLAAKMAIHQSSLPSYDQQIHVIYLANDVLLKSLPREGEAVQTGGPKSAAQAFQPALPVMVRSALSAGSHSPEVKQRLLTILEHWESRGVYGGPFIGSLKRMIGIEEFPSAGFPQASQSEEFSHQYRGSEGYQPSRPAPGAASLQPALAPSPWNHAPGAMPQTPGVYAPQGPPMPPHIAPQWEQGPGVLAFPPAMPGGYPMPHQGPSLPMPGPGPLMNPVPYGMGQPMPSGNPQAFHPSAVHPSSLPMPGWSSGPSLPYNAAALVMPPPDVGHFQAGVAEEAGTDPMGFPPGLLPDLVKEHLRTEENYTPLERRDVERAGIPAATSADSYLLARLDKFYAELQDYRPGNLRGDLQDEQKRQRGHTTLGERPSSQAKTGNKGPSDGSFKGEQGGGGPAGLGFGEAYQVIPDDPFSQYRKKRSGFYHESIARSSTVAPVTAPQSAH